MFDLAQLQLLTVVARTGSYSAAARELQLSQPAVSYQMRRLERAVGAPLAVRVGRSMRLTSAGDALLEHAEQILTDVRAAERQIAATIGSGTATVRLAAFPSSCATIVPSALAKLRSTHPELDVRVVQGEPPQTHSMVLRGDVDLALGYRFAISHEPEPEPVVSRFCRVQLVVEDIRLLLPADHPAAARSKVKVEELLSERWILGSHRFEDMLNRACLPIGQTPEVMLVADDYVAMQAFVAHGLGVALVPELALRAHQDERVVARTLVGWPARHVGLELWPDQLRVPGVVAVIEALRAALPGKTPRRR
ncbi:MAG: LysR family transcriptional regulator [Jatrophihabitans sp.]